MPSPPRRVAVVAFDSISPFHLSVPCLVFGEDRQLLGVPPFELQVCAAEPGPLRTTAGFGLALRHGLGGLRRADVVVVPSWRETGPPPSPALLAALRAAHRRGAVIVGLCLGAFVLAEAGLLDGRSATTHWGFAEAFAARYRAVHLDPTVLYVDEIDAGGVITSAGTAAALDCCLHLLRRWCGAEVASRVARRLVLAPHRHGGQAQFIDKPLPVAAADTRLHDLLHWMQAHLDQPQPLDALAARVAMSRRSFTRHFQQATGSSVGAWLAEQRLARAARLLETGTQPLEAVAAAAGFGSAVSLRQQFTARYGLPPQAWRRQFRSAAVPIQTPVQTPR